MRVVEATLHVVRLPLVHSFETSSHRKDHLDHIVVELVDESGATGWGEIASQSAPYFSPETVETTWHITQRYLLPSILGISWDHPAQVQALWRKVRGHEFAKAGVDTAAWVLWSTMKGLSLSKALGGNRDQVKAGVSLGIEPTIDELIAQVHKHVEAGYARVKLKIAPGWDVEPVREVRAVFPEQDLHVDANGAYQSTEQDFDQLRKLDDLGLTMIEQPFSPRDFLSHARLQAILGTPVCLDESVSTIDDLRTMIALQAGKILNIKVSRMGGLTKAREAHDLARDHGIPVWCGGMHEFGIGRAANVAISSLENFTLPSDVSGSDKYYRRDIIRPPVVTALGSVDVPVAPGLGFEVDREWMSENTLKKETVGI